MHYNHLSYVKKNFLGINLVWLGQLIMRTSIIPEIITAKELHYIRLDNFFYYFKD